jgi:hypothetical protein
MCGMWDIGIAFINPDVAIYRYISEDSGFLDDDGKPLPPGKTLYARVFVKKDGKWLSSTFFMQPEE